MTIDLPTPQITESGKTITADYVLGPDADGLSAVSLVAEHVTTPRRCFIARVAVVTIVSEHARMVPFEDQWIVLTSQRAASFRAEALRAFFDDATAELRRRSNTDPDIADLFAHEEAPAPDDHVALAIHAFRRAARLARVRRDRSITVAYALGDLPDGKRRRVELTARHVGAPSRCFTATLRRVDQSGEHGFPMDEFDPLRAVRLGRQPVNRYSERGLREHLRQALTALGERKSEPQIAALFELDPDSPA
jgi:hypothetical protein